MPPRHTAKLRFQCTGSTRGWQMTIANDLVAAKRKLNAAKEYFVQSRFYEAGEDFRECLRLCAKAKFSGHLTHEARAFLASTNEKLGLVP
jgi:hypothetical protein